MRAEFENKQQVSAPFMHYQAIYQDLDPQEIAERTWLDYDSQQQTFSLTLMGTRYTISHPQFEAIDSSGASLRQPYIEILLLRFLCEGAYTIPAGKMLAYEELPWGETYSRNFRGRVLGALTRTFGNDLDVFKRAIRAVPGLAIEPFGKGDVGYQFEFIDNLKISILLWSGDDEFPASAQMLFVDNFRYAFTAEDLAVVGDTVVRCLRDAASSL